MTTCGYDGRATIVRVCQGVAWVTADDRIHVTPELLDDKRACAEIETKYDIGEWCAETRCYHATLKETA